MSENGLGKPTDGWSSSKKEVTLIQCTDSKYPGPAKAKDIYAASKYFRRMKTWAGARSKVHGVPWYILSAKHGLLHPKTRIEEYDQKGLSEAQCHHIAVDLCNDMVKTAYICAGKDYTDPLTPILEMHGIDVVDNFAGMRIGERRKKLRQLAAELENESIC